LKNKETIVLCLGFHWRDFPATFPFAVCTHALHSTRARFRSVNNVGNFIYETKYLFVSISGSIRWIFLKRHTPHLPCMLYIRFTFGCNWSIMKVTLFGKEKTLRPYLGFHRCVFPETSYFAQIMLPFLKT